MAYSKEEKENILQTVFEKIEEGNSLRSVLKDSDPISKKTFFEWIKEDNQLSDQYACACESRADKIFDEILEIADESHSDTFVHAESGNEMTNHEVIQRSKLRVDARKWMLGKMNPKKYGDKMDISANVTMEQPLFPEHKKVQ